MNHIKGIDELNQYKWMRCTTCGRTVTQSETGTCISCQTGYGQKCSPDSWDFAKMRQKLKETKEKLDRLGTE